MECKINKIRGEINFIFRLISDENGISDGNRDTYSNNLGIIGRKRRETRETFDGNLGKRSFNN